ncbi:putative disease resistance protein RGA3 [Malania oleifera]|uniref:putative disease resistance protein RGA3 n=1 Tax=Malania oleifera TaxID=397392 RepID=UPI0025AE2F1F|nr:putative disease resistance protein RGA3 [Malania oleifera]
MAESFAMNLAEKILGQLKTLALDEVSLALNAKTELKKLESTVSTIKALLVDAEEQVVSNRQLRDWLRKLRDVCYDADDVLDEVEIEALRRKLVNRGSVERKVCSFFSCSNPIAFALKMGPKIKEIRLRFDEIAADKAKFNLMERSLDMRVVSKKREMTHSFERPSNIVGRNGDKEQIIQQLMCYSDHENVSVIPIVGIGGLGKTTLAKLVFNDERVVRHFQLRLWVCVAEDFDMKVVVEKIIRSATRAICCDLDMDQLQARLRETLDNRKYLLVLDDVWNEHYGKWVELKNLLMDGADGSKIVVTTRSHSVASIMGTAPLHRLSGLNGEDCVSLFVKWAVGGKLEKRHAKLLEIGNEIVKKCRGVPLAVRTLGSLLYTKFDERDWLFIRDNEIWKIEQKEDDILPALKLSYDQLPSYLKRCFAYCSIFPKNCRISSELLIQMWIAQGLVHSLDQGEELEEIGLRYFKELWSRSFFQEIDDSDFTFTFSMHDLVHDLAASVANDHCCLANSETQSIAKEVRHVSVSNDDWCKKAVPSSLLELKNVRTLNFQFYDKGPSQPFVDACIARFKRLRVLDLTGSNYEVLPGTIGDLKHLRYLDISGNFRIKTLPSSICELQSLQTLVLFLCEELEGLPRDIGNLISMRFFTMTTKQSCFPEKGIGNLTSLRFFNIARCRNLKSLDAGIQCLAALRTLTIMDCKSLVSLTGVQYLVSLENLLIYNCPKLNLLTEEEEDVQGLKSLRVLRIRELPLLTALPHWLLPQSSTLPASSLQCLTIYGCPNFTALPKWLGKLTSLQKLRLLHCPKLKSLPGGIDCLTALRLLRIESCPELSRRCVRDAGVDWHKIAHVPDIYLDCLKV